MGMKSRARRERQDEHLARAQLAADGTIARAEKAQRALGSPLLQRSLARQFRGVDVSQPGQAERVAQAAAAELRGAGHHLDGLEVVANFKSTAGNSGSMPLRVVPSRAAVERAVRAA